MNEFASELPSFDVELSNLIRAVGVFEGLVMMPSEVLS